MRREGLFTEICIWE